MSVEKTRVTRSSRLSDAPRTAILVRRRLVDLEDVSRKGCCFRGAELLDVGRIGLLAVTIAGQVHVDLFRVARSASVPGTDSVYKAGVEFLPMPADAPSLHDLAAQLDESHAR